MAVCSQCNGETPEGNAFCVNCGAKMPATTGAQSTQFGMPLLRPTTATERAGGPATTQFGPDEISALALAAKEAGLEEAEAPLKPSLMAGLPRPPVSSAPSPLTASTGLKSPITPKALPSFSPKPVPAPGQTSPQTPAARRTVMGMPLLGASAPPAAVVPEPIGVPVAPTADLTGGASAILSMDSLVNDLLNPSPVAAAAPASGQPAPQTSAAEAPTASATAEPARAATDRLVPVREVMGDVPNVRVRREPLPAQDTEPAARGRAGDLEAPKTSLVPIVVGVVLVVALAVAIFLLKG